ncbi:Ig-like domain-containing protein [Marinobacteraceae bacterium S3BR75-40.1]
MRLISGALAVGLLALASGCGGGGADSQNHLPTLETTTFTASAGASRDASLAISDDDGDTVAVSLAQAPQHGEVTLDGRQFSYRADPGFVGDDQWSVVLDDGSGETTPGTIRMTVNLPAWVEAIPSCGQDIFAYFSTQTLTPPSPGSEGYVVADTSRQDDMAGALDAFLNKDADAARTQAQKADYTLCRGTSPEANWVAWIPGTAGEGRALWAINWDPRADGLVVETPHIVHDLDTLTEGVQLSRELDARALIASGTHRCANSTASGCSGQTSVCGSAAEPYRESDMAHTEASLFQVAHRQIAAYYSNDLVISLHGFADDGISLSNGTTDSVASDSPVARLYAAFQSRLPQANLTSCNGFTGITAQQRLCGTTNVQGRQLNGSANACTQSATQASERFIHMEQSLTVRQAQSDVVLGALRTMLEGR